MALNADWLGRGGKPALEDQVIWEINQLSCQGNFETRWQEVGKGAWCEYRCNTPGIFRIRARIGDKIFTYTRRFDEPHTDSTTKYAHIGDSACIGVAENKQEIQLLNIAYHLLGAPCYAYETPWFNARDLDIALKGEGRYWTETQRDAAIGAQKLRESMEVKWCITYFSNNLRNTPKCNYFLYYQYRQAGFNIPNKIHLQGFRPPVVAEWKNPSTKIGNWLWKSAGVRFHNLGGLLWMTSTAALLIMMEVSSAEVHLMLIKKLLLTSPNILEYINHELLHSPLRMFNLL